MKRRIPRKKPEKKPQAKRARLFESAGGKIDFLRSLGGLETRLVVETLGTLFELKARARILDPERQFQEFLKIINAGQKFGILISLNRILAEHGKAALTVEELRVVFFRDLPKR